MLQIQAVPRFLTVGVGETVTFRLVSTELTELLLQGSDEKRAIWGVAEIGDNDSKKILQFSDGGMRGQGIGYEFSFTFDRPGKFAVFGGLFLVMGDKRFNGGQGLFNIPVAEYHQNVQPTDSFMWDPVNKQLTHTQDPRSAVVTVNRYLNVLQSVATPLYLQLDPQSVALRGQHEAFFKRVQQSADALADRLRSTETWIRIPVSAAHRDNSTGQVSELKIFLAHPVTQSSTPVWKLVDWSHPGDTRLDGEYDGSPAANDHDAALAAIAAFENGNQYPPGSITLTVPANVITVDVFVKSITTTGRNFWGTISDFLSSAAFWLGLLALVLTLVPVPGSQVAAAGIWLGIFSGALGAAAAGLSLYERHARNVSDASQDALDALTIVAAVAGSAGGWARHATLALRLPGAVREFVLVGVVASDSIQGVLIAKDAVIGTENAADAIFRISKDNKIAPAVKIERLLKAIGGLAVTGAMIYANVRATSHNMARLNEPPPPGPNPPPGGAKPKSPAVSLADVRDPAQTIDLTNDPRQTGNTSAGDHTTTVEHAPERALVPPTGARATSLLEQAKAANAPEELDGAPFEVFAHGTGNSFGTEMVETQGANLSANSGNFGGQLHTVPDIPVARIFGERTASKIGESAVVVGIALPRDVVARLRSGPKPLLTRDPIQNPPAGVSPNTQQWVFQRGAIETLKAKGFFFFVH